MSFNVVFLNRSFYPDISATGQLLSELCVDLVKRYDCRVTVITGRPLIKDTSFLEARFNSKLVERQDWQGVEILRVKSTTFTPAFFLKRIFNYLTYFLLAFLASFKIRKPELVVALTDPPIIGFVGLWIAFRFKIPFIISVRDVFPEAARGLSLRQNSLINFLLDCANRFLLKRADRVVALGELMRYKLIKEKGIAQAKISIISDWADTRDIRPLPKDNPFSRANKIIDNFVVMYAGNIGASSGLTVLIDAADLLRDYKDMLFVFVGEGIMKNRLMELARQYKLENIKFFPYQPRGVLSEVFSSADIFVIALKNDLSGYSVPSKIYSIMASGRPYVASVPQDCEVSQITLKFDSGVIAEPEDSRALADKILFLYANKETKIKLGENARKAAAFFEREKQVNNYFRLFNESLSAFAQSTYALFASVDPPKL
jgi:glycosyltransferase involved in cell wall biosynthesis